MFDRKDAARGYAKAAARILGENTNFLDNNNEVVPVFVSLLLQSIEISIKHIGIEGGLFSRQESLSNTCKKGHGIKELADLANERLGADDNYPIIMALTAGIETSRADETIDQMLFADEFAKTREAYQYRKLGYAEVAKGDFAIIQPVEEWVLAVNDVAENLSKSTQIVIDWKKSASKSKTFAVWFH